MATTITRAEIQRIATSPERPVEEDLVLGAGVLWGQVNVLSGGSPVLIAGWDFSLGVYLVVNGFKPSPITAGMAA